MKRKLLIVKEKKLSTAKKATIVGFIFGIIQALPFILASLFCMDVFTAFFNEGILIANASEFCIGVSELASFSYSFPLYLPIFFAFGGFLSLVVGIIAMDSFFGWLIGKGIEKFEKK